MDVTFFLNPVGEYTENHLVHSLKKTHDVLHKTFFTEKNMKIKLFN